MSRHALKINYTKCITVNLFPFKYLPKGTLIESPDKLRIYKSECKDFKLDKESRRKVENMRLIMTREDTSKEEYIELSNTLGSIYRSL